MNKLTLYILILIFFILINPINANHIIEGVIFSSDITEGVISTISVGNTPFGVAVNPVTNKVYVCNSSDNTVSVINSSSRSVEGTVQVGSDPRYLAVNSKTNKIYVANHLGNSVSVINGETKSIASTITVGQKPFATAVNSETNKIYVTNEDSNEVSVIDGLTNTVTKTIAVGQFPQGIAVNSKTNKIYVANSTSSTVSVIDGSTDSVTNTIQNVSTNPQDIAIDEGANRIFVIVSSGALYVIDGSTNTILSTFSTAKNTTNIAFHPATGKLYITVNFNDTVEVFDGRRLKPVYILGAIFTPAGVAVNSESHLIYVCDLSGDVLKVLEDSLAKEGPVSTGTIPTPTPAPETTATPGSLPTPGATPQGGGSSSNLMNELRETIAEMELTVDQLSNSHKLAKGVASAIKSVLSSFETHLNTIKGGNPSLTATEIINTCNSFLKSDLSGLRSNISKLRKKACSTSRKKRKCIPNEIVDFFVNKLEESLKKIENVVGIDIDEDTFPDVCQ